MYHFHLKENYVSYVLRYGGGVSITLQKMFMRKEKVQHFLCWDILQKDQENKIFIKCTFSWNNVVFLHFMHFISYLHTHNTTSPTTIKHFLVKVLEILYEFIRKQSQENTKGG